MLRNEQKKWKLTILLTAVAVFLLAMAPGTVAGAVIYVDAGAAGSNDGSSWADAYNDLQDGINAAGVGDEIWVAAGTYKPGSVRNDTFQLINGVAIYGGFAGSEDPATFNLADRVFETNETILSGDLLGDDEPDFANNSDNSYHVVTGSGTDATAIMDGFTVTAGNANGSFPDGRGGGMFNEGGSPTVTNCTFSGNSAKWGGGMRNNESSSPTVTNCTFSRNSAWSGGGMFNEGGSPTVTNCTFSGNSVIFSGGGMVNFENSSPTLTNCTFSGNSAGKSGSGMYNVFSSSPTLTNCTFSGNSGGNWGGGGMYNLFSSSPTVTNCTFSGNSATKWGGGMLNRNFSSPTVTNCTFSGNSAGFGGGMYNDDSSPTLTNCILWGNTAASNGNEIAVANSSTIDVNYCDVKGGQADIYNDGTSAVNWGSGNIDADPMFFDASGPDNIVGTEDDNLRLSFGSPCIDAGDNSAVPAGVTTDLDGNPRIVAGIVEMGAFEAPDPIALLLELTQQVIELNIQQGISNSLDAKLQAVIQALEDANQNNDVAAINALEAFINAVEAQSGGWIPEADADSLIATAQEAIAALNSP